MPESLAERVGVGSRVRVPFREKSALATVVALPEQTEAKGRNTMSNIGRRAAGVAVGALLLVGLGGAGFAYAQTTDSSGSTT